MGIINFLVRSFYDIKYKFSPPEMVKYWKRGDSAKAKLVTTEEGHYALQIENEERTYPGFPRGHVLNGPLAAVKNALKNTVFNQVFGQLDKWSKEHNADMLPPERMVPAVRHIHDTFLKLEECEVVPDMKARIALIRKVLCWFLSEDDAYRFRAQLFLDLIEQKQIRLSKDDLYYARAKYWRPDRFKKIMGKTFDGFTY